MKKNIIFTLIALVAFTACSSYDRQWDNMTNGRNPIYYSESECGITYIYKEVPSIYFDEIHFRPFEMAIPRDTKHDYYIYNWIMGVNDVTIKFYEGGEDGILIDTIHTQFSVDDNGLMNCDDWKLGEKIIKHIKHTGDVKVYATFQSPSKNKEKDCFTLYYAPNLEHDLVK